MHDQHASRWLPPIRPRRMGSVGTFPITLRSAALASGHLNTTLRGWARHLGGPTIIVALNHNNISTEYKYVADTHIFSLILRHKMLSQGTEECECSFGFSGDNQYIAWPALASRS